MLNGDPVEGCCGVFSDVEGEANGFEAIGAEGPPKTEPPDAAFPKTEALSPPLPKIPPPPNVEVVVEVAEGVVVVVVVVVVDAPPKIEDEFVFAVLNIPPVVDAVVVADVEDAVEVPKPPKMPPLLAVVVGLGSSGEQTLSESRPPKSPPPPVDDVVVV